MGLKGFKLKIWNNILLIRNKLCIVNKINWDVIKLQK